MSGRCAGLLEMFHNGKWRRVSLIYILSHEKTSEEENKLEIASLVCKQLNCGSAVASLFAENQKDEDGVAAVCTGSESALQECNVLYMSLGSSTGVVCSGISGNRNKFLTLRSEEITWDLWINA